MTSPAILLRCLAVLLGALLAAEIGPPPARQPAAILPAPIAPQAAEPHPEQTAQEVAVMLARPLFTPGRHAPSAAPVQPVARSDTPLPRLSGIMIDGSHRRAIFETKDKRDAIGVGGQVGDWRILAIAPWRVTLQGPDGIQTVSLAYGDPRDPPPAPPPSVLDILNSGQAPVPTDIPKVPTLQEMMAKLPHILPPR